MGFASQKNFIGLYTLRLSTDVMGAHRNLLKGKGAIRYSGPGQIDFRVVESTLATQESNRLLNLLSSAFKPHQIDEEPNLIFQRLIQIPILMLGKGPQVLYTGLKNIISNIPRI